jgi:hypothetical protein
MKLTVTPSTMSIARDVPFDLVVRVSMTTVGATIDVMVEQRIGAAGATPWRGTQSAATTAEPPGTTSGVAVVPFQVRLAGPCSAAHLLVTAHDRTNGWFTSETCTVAVT